MSRREDVPRLGRAPAPRTSRPRLGSPWATAAWLTVLLLAGAAQVLRGTADDTAIFLVPAALLAADALGVLPRPRAAPDRLRRLLPAATVVVGIVLALAPRHSVLDGVVLAALGAVVLVAAWPDPPDRPPPRRDAVRQVSSVLWAVAAASVGLWELASFFLGFGSDLRSAAHPTISGLLDPVADTPVGRILLAVVWTLTGLALLRRGRS